MKTTVKKILLTLSAVMLFAVLLCFNASALDKKGKCGDNVIWSFDSTTGTLTISGEGNMHDYFWEGSPFYQNSEIKSVIVEDGVTGIGVCAFEHCYLLESVTIPDSVTSIGVSAFSYTSPEKITVFNNGAVISSLPSSALIWCYKDSAAHSYCVENNRLFVLIDGTDEDNKISGTIGKFSWNFNKATGLLTISGNGVLPAFGDAGEPWKAYNEHITTIEYANGITEVMSGHSNHTNLKTVIIPESVTSIGEDAFSFCEGLKSITIPDSVTSIGDGAFYECGSLEGITIPNSLISIGSSAFRECGSLKSITIPDSVTRIGSCAFYHCSSLESITIGSGVTSIKPSVFCGCTSLESITIPDSVTSIGSEAFYKCERLKSITIPDSVISIDRYAFYNCASLESITIGNGLTSIAPYTFDNCSSLESLSIPYSVEKIYESVLPGTLKEIYIFSPDCVFEKECGLNYSNTIYGFKGSTAESFADEIGAVFIDIETVHTHKEVVIPGKEATCSEKGLTEGKRCTECGVEFVKQEEIPLAKHTLTTLKAVAPTYTKTGLTEGKKCSACGKVTVKQKKVAKKKLKKVTVSSVKSTKAKTATVTWKKVTDASGYIVEYSTSKKFTKKTTKTIKIKKGKTTKTTLKKLKSGKKYYVRVKAYRTENKKTVYGSYSSVKTVKIK